MRKLAALAAVALVGLVAIWGGTSLALREDGGGSAGLAGTYPSRINVREDVSGHHQFIQMPDNVNLEVSFNGPNISIDGPHPWVAVSGTFTGGEFSATGMGTVAGFPDIVVLFQGTLGADALAGNYWMGVEGGLPGGNYINYEVKPPKLYSITVLKRNDETKQGLSGWEMNLYQGAGCSGSPIDNGTTGDDGIVEFTRLLAGRYSVQEKPQSGWNNVTPLCQDTTLPSAAGGTISGLPACPIQPDLPFPDPGCDEFNSAATVQVVFTNPPIDPLECDLGGPTQITRGPVVSGPPDSIQTEIVAMELTGNCQPGQIAVTVTESPTRDSTGRIEEQTDQSSGTLEFDANSFFDVYFKIDTPLGVLHNQDPLHLSCKISAIPPYGCLYEPDVGVISLFDVTEKEVGTLLHAAHVPLDPNKVLVIFSNERKPTPTATPTPTEKRFSITVLKENADTGAPLSGWDMNLYAGTDCSGRSIGSGTTDDDGLVDFTGLEAGPYSVQEKGQTGWNVVGEECQDVQLGGTASGMAGFTNCPIDDLPFPAPGCDSFDSGAQVNIAINATGDTYSVTLNGPTVIQRGPVGDTEPNSLDDVQAKIVQIDLAGTNPTLGPIIVRQSPTRDSLGAIEEQDNTIPSVIDFPADSFFDVFFQIDLPNLGMTLHNEDPFQIECKIDEIPPLLCLYQPPVPEPIELLDEHGVKIATIVHGLHIPLPPNEVLVVFSNRPKLTPTPGATGTRTPAPEATDTPAPTATPTPATIEPTPTATPAGEACTDPSPSGGGELLFSGIGTPDHAATRQGDVCVGESDVWTFSTLGAPIEQFIGIKVTEKTGSVSVSILRPDGTAATLEPGEEFRDSHEDHPAMYEVTVTGTGESLASYRLHVCRSITSPCVFSEGITPKPGPGDVDCDTMVNSIDALLVLQLVADLINFLLCEENADVNQDGETTSVDAALILQFDAGLLLSLPPQGSAGRDWAAAIGSRLSLLW